MAPDTLDLSVDEVALILFHHGVHSHVSKDTRSFVIVL